MKFEIRLFKIRNIFFKKVSKNVIILFSMLNVWLPFLISSGSGKEVSRASHNKHNKKHIMWVSENSSFKHIDYKREESIDKTDKKSFVESIRLVR